MKNYGKTIYIVVFLLILLVPSLGLLIWGPSDAENDDALEMPSIVSEEGEFNLNFMSDLGSFFESRFALRSEMVTGYSLITGKIFSTSSQSSVITGTNGWLFYTDTLGDFQRTNILTGRQLNNCVTNLRLINEYCNENGITFLFALASNKNTLYSENMPYYYSAGVGEGNRELLFKALSGTDINCIDLYDVFSQIDGVYYFERDSHWNNMGAAIAADALLDSCGAEGASYENLQYEIVKTHEGDLEQMVYPGAVRAEEDYEFAFTTDFTYDQEVESNFDYRISTSAEGEGSLLMYRDSFGSSLLPFMARNFESALFSRSSSCQISDVLSRNPDVLIIEKAERFISQLCTNPARLPSPLRTLPEDATEITPDDLESAEAGDFITVTGTLPSGSFTDTSIIYICCGDLVFEAYPVSDINTGSESFTALLEKNSVSTDNIKVFIA